MGEVIWNARFTRSPLTARELAACRALAAFKRWHWHAMGETNGEAYLERLANRWSRPF
jgi:hypothetical protein